MTLPTLHAAILKNVWIRLDWTSVTGRWMKTVEAEALELERKRKRKRKAAFPTRLIVWSPVGT